MTRDRTLLLLRVAFSAACGILCLLLIVLCVRSFWWIDGINGPITETMRLRISSARGSISGRLDTVPLPVDLIPGWRISHQSYRELEPIFNSFQAMGRPVRFHSHEFGIKHDTLFIPHWFLALVSGMGAFAFGMRPSYRYGLRTLLIATTVLSVMFGTIVYSIK
jgi:hypothetical protein